LLNNHIWDQHNVVAYFLAFPNHLSALGGLPYCPGATMLKFKAALVLYANFFSTFVSIQECKSGKSASDQYFYLFK